jgi:hypothetical protein
VVVVGLTEDFTGLLAIILLVLIGLLNCLISHKHIIPSFEKDATLFANCVPITLKELTGYLWH